MVCKPLSNFIVFKKQIEQKSLLYYVTNIYIGDIYQAEKIQSFSWNKNRLHFEEQIISVMHLLSLF